MPELPEVETVKLGLNRLINNLVITDISFDWPKGFPNSKADVDNFLIGAKVLSVKRRGKALIVFLDSSYCLVIHLKMTGQLVFRGYESFGAGHPNDSLIGPLPDKSTRVVISFEDGSKLFFNDQRKFGWMRLMPEVEVPNLNFMKKLGPEPLSSEFTKKEFIERVMRRKNSSIKATILDQTVLAGVGNIYADESLWAAKIHPASLTGSISKAKLGNLYEAIREILARSIELGGSTDRNYVDAEGKRGSYLEFANVFRREGQNCPRCNSIIIKTKVASRGTHICLKCQRKTK